MCAICCLVDYLLNCQHVLCSKIESFHFEKLTASWTLTFLYCYFSIIYGMWILSSTGLAIWFPFFLSSRYFEAQYKIIIIKNGGRLSVNYILVVFMLDHFPVLVPSAGIKCRLSKTINIQLTKRLKIDWFIPLWFHCLVAWSYKLLGSTLNESCL